MTCIEHGLHKCGFFFIHVCNVSSLFFVEQLAWVNVIYSIKVFHYVKRKKMNPSIILIQRNYGLKIVH